MYATTSKTSKLLSKSILTADQNAAITQMVETDATFLVAGTGAGKTAITLTALDELRDLNAVRRTLVIAPLKVCQSAWASECDKWAHLAGTEVTLCLGTEDERNVALACRSEITVINNENVPWLFKKLGRKHGFDSLVIDELSKWRETGGKQFRALRPYLKDFGWRLGMTATPVAEDWTGLFGQMLTVDEGKRLGRSKDKYLRTFFYPTDYECRNWELLPGSDSKIAELVRDIVHVMPDYKDDLKGVKLNEVYVTLDEGSMAYYQTMLRDMVLDIEGDSVESVNAAVLSGKLCQIANGFMYDDAKNEIEIHDTKLVWAENRANDLMSAGENVVIAYWYKADYNWLREAYPDALHIGSGMKKGELAEVLLQWRVGSGQVLLLHPASAGHGVDGLQHNGHHLIWLQPCASRDLWEQTAGRLDRRGQTDQVIVDVILAENTVDGPNLARVQGKGDYHELLLKHLGEVSV